MPLQRDSRPKRRNWIYCHDQRRIRNTIMNKSDADTILARWGSWVRTHSDIGYNKENTIGRMMREGLGAGHSDLNLIENMPPEVEIAERIILKMSKEAQKAVKVKYLARLPNNDAAKKCRCNVDQYLSLVDKAVNFTARYLSMVE